MLRNPRCLHNRLTDGDKVVSPTHRPRSTPLKHYFSATGTRFCYRLSKFQGLVQLEGLGKLKKFTSSGLEVATFQLSDVAHWNMFWAENILLSVEILFLLIVLQLENKFPRSQYCLHCSPCARWLTQGPSPHPAPFLRMHLFYILSLFFSPEDGGRRLLQNTGGLF
jgi:hypothetical protein